jgi:hypothetical protein
VCVDEATDPQNCGGCGLACDHCTDGRCIRVLASGQSNPIALAVTSSEVVWANYGSSETGPGPIQGAAVLKLPIGGGVPETLATAESGMVTSESLAVDSGYVYWAKWNPDSASGDGAIMKTPLAGGATMTVASTNDPQSVAVSGGVVYWTAVAGIMSLPTTGGSPAVFEAGNIFPLTLAAGHAFWFDVEADALAIRTRSLAPGASELTLGSWDLSGPPHDVCLPNMASSHAGRIWLTVSPTDLYWSYSADGGGCAAKLPLSGGTSSTIEWDLDAGALAVDATSVYWIVESSSPTVGPNLPQILKAPLAGGTPISLAKMMGGDVGSIVVDDTSVYFTDTFGGNVVKVTPK